jgi:peptide/nickel transport system permease protein
VCFGAAPYSVILFKWAVARHAALPALSIILTSVGAWALTMRGFDGEHHRRRLHAAGGRQGSAQVTDPVVVFRAQRHSAAVDSPRNFDGVRRLWRHPGGDRVLLSNPGFGYQLFQAIVNSDYTVIQGITLVLAISVGLSVLMIDLIYPRLDPRVTYVAENTN